MRVNTLRGSELWARCPYCGDSTHNPNKAHLRIHLDSGMFFCHRCQVNGIMPAGVMLQLAGMDLVEFQPRHPVTVTTLTRGPGSERSSRLERWHTEHSDAFKMWLPSRDGWYQSGLYLRKKHDSRIVGTSGISWPGAPDRLSSSPSDPLILVEGPYDVTADNRVSVFGYFSKHTLSALKGHFFWLMPDGDTWLKKDLFTTLRQRINWAEKRQLGILGLYYLKGGADPDENPEAVAISIREWRQYEKTFYNR